MEDLYGSIEVIAFENAYQTAGSNLMEDNIVLLEGRLSIREEEQNVTIIANKIEGFPLETVPFGNQETSNTALRKVLNINITNLSEKQKEQLRGVLKFFTGDRNNTPVYIINGESKMPAGGIFLNGNTLEEIEEIVEKENVIIGE